MITDLAGLLVAVRPGEPWALDGDTYEGLRWLADTPKPTLAELESAWPAFEASSEKAKIQRARAVRYRAETDPMFFKAQRGEDGVTMEAWQASVDAIRADLPYPS